MKRKRIGVPTNAWCRISGVRSTWYIHSPEWSARARSSSIPQSAARQSRCHIFCASSPGGLILGLGFGIYGLGFRAGVLRDSGCGLMFLRDICCGLRFLRDFGGCGLRFLRDFCRGSRILRDLRAHDGEARHGDPLVPHGSRTRQCVEEAGRTHVRARHRCRAGRDQISDFKTKVSEPRFQNQGFKTKVSKPRFQNQSFKTKISKFPNQDFKIKVSEARFQEQGFKHIRLNPRSDSGLRLLSCAGSLESGTHPRACRWRFRPP